MSFTSAEETSTDSMEYMYSDLSLPMMDLDDQLSFDYTAFLQDEPSFIVGEGSSTSACTQPSAITSPQGLSPNDLGPCAGPSSQQTKLKHERRGHTKSRRGCFNCKRRRIKCQETRPACGHCVKSGLNCEYPVAPQVIHQPQHQIPLFSLQDMRFFQHFLMTCHPHHPIGAESIWTHEIPCLSEKYEYLMHALLGLAASDLSKSTPSSTLHTAAMTHRLKAIRAIKHTLSSVPRSTHAGSTWEEGNALMATCFALTFQSVLLEDGMVEYMTFIRGVVIVGIQMYLKGARLLFGRFLGEGQVSICQHVMEKVPLVDGEWMRRAVEAVDGLAGLCKGEVERGYWERLRGMAVGLGVSSWTAYQAMSQHYAWWMMLPHEQFRRIIDPENQVCILLASHWIAVKQIMAVITEAEWKARGETAQRAGDGNVELGMIRWLKYLNGLVDADHAAYNQWPTWVEAQLDRDRGFFGKTR